MGTGSYTRVDFLLDYGNLSGKFKFPEYATASCCSRMEILGKGVLLSSTNTPLAFYPPPEETRGLLEIRLA